MSIEEKLTDLGGSDVKSVNPLELPINGMTGVFQQAASTLKANSISPVMSANYSSNPLAVTNHASGTILSNQQFIAQQGLEISAGITGENIGNIGNAGHFSQSLEDLLNTTGAELGSLAELENFSNAQGFVGSLLDEITEAGKQMSDQIMGELSEHIADASLQTEPILGTLNQGAKELGLG